MLSDFRKLQKSVAPFKGRKTYGRGIGIRPKSKSFGGSHAGFWNWGLFDKLKRNHFKSRRLF